MTTGTRRRRRRSPSRLRRRGRRGERAIRSRTKRRTGRRARRWTGRRTGRWTVRWTRGRSRGRNDRRNDREPPSPRRRVVDPRGGEIPLRDGSNRPIPPPAHRPFIDTVARLGRPSCRPRGGGYEPPRCRTERTLQVPSRVPSRAPRRSRQDILSITRGALRRAQPLVSRVFIDDVTVARACSCV